MMIRGKFTVLILAVCAAVSMTGCSAKERSIQEPSAVESTDEKANDETSSQEKEADGKETDFTEGLGDTLITDDIVSEAPSPIEEEKSAENADTKDVDLIFFMGQSNMSGAAGDASLAPQVSEDAGMEFRAVSDPTKLYPIKEPFGINENNPTGLYEYPGAKKGSLVSAFVNEYHKLTGRKVIAVSASMGATDMDKWMTQGVIDDVGQRYNGAIAYLRDNGYNIGHIYALWLHGESDAIKGTDPEVYRTDLDNIMRPLFINGLQKVFLITPGRTIDYRDIFLDIINVEKQICAESGYYALATTVLTKVSTEYMTDQYHYNQHVLNMVGIESAASVAYFTQHGEEKIVYDYREGEYIVPEGTDPDSQGPQEHLELSEMNINEVY